MGLRAVKQIIGSVRTVEGGGFVVRRPFPTAELPQVDPFLLFDHMGPIVSSPGEAKGAPDHPHRGFETVTYLLQGSMQHEDSAGHRGSLEAGDVQWMTAGRGVVHAEMPSAALLARTLHGSGAACHDASGNLGRTAVLDPAKEQQSVSGLRSGVRPSFPRLVPFANRPMKSPGWSTAAPSKEFSSG